jgi:hypothetical protein
MLRTYAYALYATHLCTLTCTLVWPDQPTYGVTMSYEEDSNNQAISTNKHRDNLAIYHQDKETVDKQMDNLMEYVFGDVLFREVE